MLISFSWNITLVAFSLQSCLDVFVDLEEFSRHQIQWRKGLKLKKEPEKKIVIQKKKLVFRCIKMAKIQGTNTYPISLIGWTIRTYFIFGWLLLNNKCVRKNFAICHGCCWQKSGGEARVPLLPPNAWRCPYLHILSHKKKLSNSTSFVTILMNSTTTKKRGLCSSACVYVVCK